MTLEQKNVGTLTDDIMDEITPTEKYTICETICTTLSVLIVLLLLPISIPFVIMVAKEYERIVVLRMGKVRDGRPKGPGIVVYLPCVDSTHVVNLRIETLSIRPQEVLSKDSCSVTVDAVVYFRVINPVSAIISVYSYKKATLMMAASTLRNVVGQENILDIFSERTKLAIVMKKILDVQARPWGVCIDRVEMKEVSLPDDMQRAMAAEAEATRDARAKIIVAEGELKAAEAMRDASETIGTNEAALHLRYIQTLVSIKNENTRTFVFPIPMGWIK